MNPNQSYFIWTFSTLCELLNYYYVSFINYFYVQNKVVIEEYLLVYKIRADTPLMATIIVLSFRLRSARKTD